MLIPAFVQNLIISKVVSFILDRLNTFQSGINWDLVTTDLDEKVRAIVPFTIFDNLAVDLANSTLKMIREALGSSDVLGRVIVLLSQQEYSQAADLLTSSVAAYLEGKPQSMAEVNIKSHLESFVA